MAGKMLPRSWPIASNCLFGRFSREERRGVGASAFAMDGSVGHFVEGILGRHLAVKDVVEHIVGVLLPISREEGDHIACLAGLSCLLCRSDPIEWHLSCALPVILHIFLHLWV